MLLIKGPLSILLASAAAMMGEVHSATAQLNFPNCGPSMGGGMGGNWLGWLVGPLVMLLFIAAIAALVIFAVRSFGGSQISPMQNVPGFFNDPIDILKERFAKGEIDGKEFEARSKTLKS